METVHVGNVLFASFIVPKHGNEVLKFHSANTTASFATLFPSNELRAPSSGAPSLRAFAFPPAGQEASASPLGQLLPGGCSACPRRSEKV